MGKTLYDQPTNSNVKKIWKNRKLITEQGEDYATGCLLDYKYIKNHYPLIAADLSGHKELDADPIQLKKIDFNGNATHASNYQFIFMLTVLEKLKETMLKCSQGRVTVLW